jgi:acyl-ACP thioesterase
MAVAVHRYPRYEEALRVNTWSSGIRAFKGYRDFRAYCGGELIVSASSVWLYFNIAAKAICRVPREIAAGFPSHKDSVFCPELEKLTLEPPAGGSIGREISVRYSDFDSNDHVNNTVYFDYLQTALVAGGFSPRPRDLQIQFLREITPGIEQVKVSLEPRGGAVAFGLGSPAGFFAHGLAT